MSEIRFRMVPPGTAARLSEEDRTAPARPRIQGGDAARLHEERVAMEGGSARLRPQQTPLRTGFTLRAQGGHIVRANSEPKAVLDGPQDSLTARAAETADPGGASPPPPNNRSQLFQSLIESVQTLFRRR